MEEVALLTCLKAKSHLWSSVYIGSVTLLYALKIEYVLIAIDKHDLSFKISSKVLFIFCYQITKLIVPLKGVLFLLRKVGEDNTYFYYDTKLLVDFKPQ